MAKYYGTTCVIRQYLPTKLDSGDLALGFSLFRGKLVGGCLPLSLIFSPGDGLVGKGFHMEIVSATCSQSKGAYRWERSNLDVAIKECRGSFDVYSPHRILSESFAVSMCQRSVIGTTNAGHRVICILHNIAGMIFSRYPQRQRE